LDVKANSIWLAHYKYASDLTGQALFRTSNLMGGMAQRMAPFAKNTFGIQMIVGDPVGEDEKVGKAQITCMWVFESKNVPEEIKKDNIDYEMFDWVRADWKKDKAQVEEYLKAAGKLGTETVLETHLCL